MKKINLKLILLQWLALVFFIHGIIRIYYSLEGETIAKISKSEKIDTIVVAEFLEHQVYLALGAFLLGVFLVFLINLKNKNHFLNSIIVTLLVFVLFPMRFFFRGVVHSTLNSLGTLFTNNYTWSFAISGIVYIVISFLLLWITKHAHDRMQAKSLNR